MTEARTKKVVSRCAAIFKDADGNVIIWQFPNIPLAGWLLFKLLSMISLTNSIQRGFENLSAAFLFTWAYLEIVSGKSHFRRILGVIVMTAIIVGYFRKL